MSLQPSTHSAGRPHVFIGSSTEGLHIANNLQVLLDYECEVELWNQGTFEPGGTTLASLASQARTFDFAVLVVTPDDTVETRGEKRSVTRDNVLFELGLFMGALGKERVYMLYDRLNRPNLPTDLAGVTAITYALHKNGNFRASLGASATQLREVFNRLGVRQPEVTEVQLTQASEETSSAEALAGAEIRRTGEDAVAAMLDRFIRYSGDSVSRDVHDRLVATGWVPSTPPKSTYIRWTYTGRRAVSLFQNSAQLVAASKRLVDVVRDLPGGDHRLPKNEVVFPYSDGVDQAFVAAEAIRRFADGQ